MINKEEICKRLKKEGPKKWYHNFEIIKSSGIFCDPSAPPLLNNSKLIFEKFNIEEDFWKGLRVLDIGSFTGARSFYLEDCGAEVIALDVQSPANNGFKLIHEIRKSKVDFVLSSVYDISPSNIGKFDVVLFYGVFYHLKHPLLALERINSVCKKEGLLLGGGTSADRWFHDSDESCEKGADFSNITRDMVNNERIMNVDNLNQLSLCGFSGSHYYLDKSNWFIPNSECLIEWLKVSGFDVEKLSSSSSLLATEWNKKGILRNSISFKAKHVGEPISEYQHDTYKTVSRVDKKLYMKKYRIPTEYEAEMLKKENKKLKDEIRKLKERSKSKSLRKAS